MSLGGDFYAVPEAHLDTLLAGAMDFHDYRGGRLSEKPAECYSDAEWIWDILFKMFEDDDVCGKEPSEVIAEHALYNRAAAVPAIAATLAGLDDATLRERFHAAAQAIDEDPDCEDDEILDLLHGLVAFYQRAASNGHAVIYHIT